MRRCSQVQQFGPMTTRLQEDMTRARAEAAAAVEAKQSMEETLRCVGSYRKDIKSVDGASCLRRLAWLA